MPIRSLLTAAACQGILRREERAGRQLDPHLKKAILETLRLWLNVAEVSGTPKQEAFAPRYVPKLENIKAAIQTDQYCVARNLTWTECEKLMGVSPRLDGRRGRLLGNAVIPTIVEWIGRKIIAVEKKMMISA